MEPDDIQDIIEGTYPIPALNANNDVLRALLPTAAQKAALGTLAPPQSAIPNSTGTLADNTRAINAVLAALRSAGVIEI